MTSHLQKKEATFKSNPNPGKLNTSFWQNAFNKKEGDATPKKDVPKKVNLYGKSFYDDKEPADEEPKPKPATVDRDNDNKEDMIEIRGKCITSGCKCRRYMENTSRWSKGKCNTCDHAPATHKTQWVKPGGTISPTTPITRQTRSYTTSNIETTILDSPLSHLQRRRMSEHDLNEQETESKETASTQTHDMKENTIYDYHTIHETVSFASAPSIQKLKVENETLQIQVNELIKKLSESDKIVRAKNNNISWKQKYNKMKKQFDDYKEEDNRSSMSQNTQHSKVEEFKKQLAQLFDIVQTHLDFMEKQEALVNEIISNQPCNKTLHDAKQTALCTEKELLDEILNNYQMQRFLENIILMENLFDSIYTEKERKKQKAARIKHASDIAEYEAKPKPICDVSSFVDLLFAGTTYIDKFKAWLQKLTDLCKQKNIKIISNSGAKGKKIQRAFYKAFYVYSVVHKHDGYKRMTDVLRCSLVFASFSDLYRCFHVIRELAEEENNGGILRCKDRFHPVNVNFGYRDLLINVYCPGTKIVCEIQLHHKLFYQHKTISHDIYKKARLFEKNGSNEAYKYANQHYRVDIGDQIYEMKGNEEKLSEDTPRAWLKKWGLQKYTNPLLVQYGCDDVNDWVGLTLRTLRNFGFSENDAKKFEMQAKKMHNNPVLLLERWGLTKYKEVLIEKSAYHDIGDWASLKFSKLQTEMKFKPGHAWKFMRCVKQRNAISYDYKTKTGRPYNKKKTTRGRGRGRGRGRDKFAHHANKKKSPPPSPDSQPQKADD